MLCEVDEMSMDLNDGLETIYTPKSELDFGFAMAA
jgi:hypothetical protein